MVIVTYAELISRFLVKPVLNVRSITKTYLYLFDIHPHGHVRYSENDEVMERISVLSSR